MAEMCTDCIHCRQERILSPPPGVIGKLRGVSNQELEFFFTNRHSGHFDITELRATGLFYLICWCPLGYWFNVGFFFRSSRRTPTTLSLNNVLMGSTRTWAADFMSLGGILSGPQFFLSMFSNYYKRHQSTEKIVHFGLMHE